MRPAGLVRQSMPALVKPEHAVGASPVVVKQETRMPLRVTGDSKPVGRKRLIFPRHSTSPARPVMDLISNAVWWRLSSGRVCCTPSWRTGRAYQRLHKHQHSGNGPSRTNTNRGII